MTEAGVDLSRWRALVLAGGAGSRFGGPKLLAPFRGGLLLDAALDAALAAPVGGVVLVTGAGAEAVGAAANALARRRARADRLVLAHAPDHAEGLSASLKAGLSALPADCEGVAVFLGDMPDIPAGLVARLAGRLTAGRLAAAPVHEGRRGHPVMMRSALFPRLRALTGDAGAGAVLAGLGEALALVETGDPGVLRDIDRPADL